MRIATARRGSAAALNGSAEGIDGKIKSGPRIFAGRRWFGTLRELTHAYANRHGPQYGSPRYSRSEGRGSRASWPECTSTRAACQADPLARRPGHEENSDGHSGHLRRHSGYVALLTGPPAIRRTCHPAIRDSPPMNVLRGAKAYRWIHRFKRRLVRAGEILHISSRKPRTPSTLTQETLCAGRTAGSLRCS